MKFIIFAALSLALVQAAANDKAEHVLPPYTAICVDESAERYFLGEEGRWRSERIEAQGRVELEKLDFQPSGKTPGLPGMAACTPSRITSIAPHIQFVEECYSVKEVNDKGVTSERREMCSEYYYEGEIVSVDCRVLSFQPNGTFQRQRWVAGNQQQGQDAVLKTAGTCRVMKR